MSTPRSTPPVRTTEEYFNSSRLRVIGMITAATVAVGALGGIAGIAFDPDPVPKDHVVQPGGEGNGTVGSPGNASPRSGKVPLIARAVPGADSTASPSPLGTITDGTEGTDGSSPTEEATDEPTQGGDDGSDGGSGTTIAATGVDIYVPSGWNVDFQNDNQVFQSNGQGSFSFAFSVVDDPSVAASDIITENLQGLLPPENYTQLQTSEVVPLQPFGSVVSLAGIEYEALWVDNQGSISIHGLIYVGVRQDGTVLGIVVERVPAEDFEDAFEEMIPILDNSFGRFGGLG